MKKMMDVIYSFLTWPWASRTVRQHLTVRGAQVGAEAVQLRIRRNVIERALLGEE